MPTGSNEPAPTGVLPDPASLEIRRAAKIPVLILSGFLGSGKSSLINRWLRDPAARHTAVVVNEFGEIGLDHLLVEQASEDTILLPGGCLCCAVQSDLVKTLRGLLARRERRELPPYERVIVETSGLADCAPLLQSFMTDPLRLSLYHLAALWVAVDGELGPRTLARHRQARRQVALADRLLVTKTDRIDGEREQNLRKILAEYSGAPVVRADRQAMIGITDAKRPGTRRMAERPPSAPHRARDHDAYLSLHRWLPHPLSAEALYRWARALLDDHGEQILRMKGLIPIAGELRPQVFQSVQHVMERLTPLERWPDEEPRGWLEVIAATGLSATLQAQLDALVEQAARGQSQAEDLLRSGPSGSTADRHGHGSSRHPSPGSKAP